MRSHRENPDSEANQQLTRENERAVFTAKMEAKPRCQKCNCVMEYDDDYDEFGKPVAKWWQCPDCLECVDA